MSLNPHIQRAELLHEQGRYDLAETELRQALSQQPDDAYAHALLALCLKEREKFKDATTEAQHAVHLAPDFAFAHYALAIVWTARNFPTEAFNAVNEAIRLDPSDPDYFALQAALHFDSSRWMAALKSAEQGLQFNAEHVGCNNLRAMALIKLGRREEAGATIDSSLSRNPENALTHANQGWAYLEKNDPEKALYHFKEALRLEPDHEWAREGIVTALKAKYFIYSWMLRYFLWMAKLPPQTQFAVVIAGFFGNRLLGSLANSNPSLEPFIWPIRLLYVAFAILTWTANPLFNLLLRLNRYGRMVLSREQIVSTNWIGGCLLFAAVAVPTAFLIDNGMLLLLGGAAVFLILPLSGAFSLPAGWPRGLMACYIAVLVVAAVLGSYYAMQPDTGLKNRGMTLASFFVIGVFFSGWVVNGLMFVRVRR